MQLASGVFHCSAYETFFCFCTIRAQPQDALSSATFPAHVARPHLKKKNPGPIPDLYLKTPTQLTPRSLPYHWLVPSLVLCTHLLGAGASGHHLHPEGTHICGLWHQIFLMVRKTRMTSIVPKELKF